MQLKVWQLRTQRGLTLRQLEKLSGISKSQLNAIENGQANPTVYTLERIADALGVQLIELFAD